MLITFLLTTAVMWVLIGYVGMRRRGTLAEHEPPDAEGGIRWILIGGFAILRADSREQALAMAQQVIDVHAAAGVDVAMEVRPLMESGPQA